MSGGRGRGRSARVAGVPVGFVGGSGVFIGLDLTGGPLPLLWLFMTGG